MKVGFVSLGCSKNLVDTEIAIGKFKKNEFEIVNNPEKAEIIVINTCGFIETAKEEAINTILEMSEYKKKRCKYLVVMGCLVQRYYAELKKALPEVDLFIKLEDYDKLWDLIENMLKNEEVFIKKAKKAYIPDLPMFTQEEYLNKVISTGQNYAYLKIGEGCSNFCTYCAIPYIRGKFISRPMEEILEEAKTLAKSGIKELIVIAQDTTKYGEDIYGEPKLAELLENLCKIDGVHWIRFLYSYPEGITDKLIKVVKNEKKISKYFDIPIQHISDDVLKRMNRKTSKKNIENIISKIRREIPEATIRTSLIVGFPGETKEQFQELYDFVKKTEFDKLGVFEYSKEDGTPACKMKNHVHYKTKIYRHNKIMELQQHISNKKCQQKIGTTQEVIIENISLDKKFFIGRTKNDVPEIDGVVYVKKEASIKPNTFIKCKITNVSNYDLFGQI